ncbi:MAG: CusA/CzcA family heavy metal efflux RND transporter [Chitinophagales bacterium]
MFNNIIAYSIKNKFVVGMVVIALIIWGAFSIRQLPIDAVPDITNNQVLVITTSPSLATQEIEQFITTPIEIALQNLQDVVEIRSVSRFGLSVITIVFEEKLDIYLARQLVSEHLQEAKANIPEGLGTPQMAPISTGLGEIYQYVVRPEEGYEDKFSPTELRSIQDWIIKPQLAGTDGVVEVNTLGGFLKQYEVAVDPILLKAMNISIADVFTALENSNENTGGAYIENYHSTYYIRTNGIAKSLKDIGDIVIDVRNGRSILISDVAKVQFGKAPRYGALTRDGEEVVGGTVMMLKGANSALVTKSIKNRVEQIQKSLPEGVVIEPYLVRDKLITTAIGTVKKNLIEGGLIVIFILVLMLGNWRAGLIVASVIPLAMLFAISMMNVLGISANLMSLGAIDFGLIVDGAVIIVESIVHRLQVGFSGKKLTKAEMDKEVMTAAQKIRSSAAFGEIIILIVYLPILALVGIEGKMFIPMAQTVMLAIGGALILSLTYVPMMSALFLNKNISNKTTIANRIIRVCQRLYTPVLTAALRFKTAVIIATLILFGVSVYTYTQMGGEFIPTLEEGDFALHQILPPGSSLSQSIEVSKLIQRKLMDEFPEVIDVVTKIGSAEIPTDPMPVETGDIIVVMKPKKEWTSAKSREELFEKFETSLKEIPGVAYEFTQPIQMRFNELMTGSRADVAIKLYGDDLNLLYEKAKEAEAIIKNVKGVRTTKVDQTTGMPQIVIDYKYDRMAQYGLQVKDINRTVSTAFAGEQAGIIYEGDKRFDLVVRLDESYRNNINDVQDLYINLPNGSQVPLQAVADVQLIDAPMQISRDNAKRFIVIGVNIGATDVESLVKAIQSRLDDQLELPSGYYLTYGGQFENLKAANARLAVAVPIALGLIFILLFFTFGSVAQALLIFTAIPLSAIGGIWALVLRGMPFSISAGIGFIALFGVAVLNGIVLIGYFNQLKNEGMTNIHQRIIKGTSVRLRPVLMTAAVASLGFLPMALSRSGGAEVQRPLATVVIGGLITATFLTLIVIPVLYSWLMQYQEKKTTSNKALLILPFLMFTGFANAQDSTISLEMAVETAINNHPGIKAASLEIDKYENLQGLKYNPGTTDIAYKGDGLFTGNPNQVNEIGVTQQFSNLGYTKAANAMNSELLAQSVLQKSIIEKELQLEVQQLYFEIQYQREILNVYDELIALYDDYTAKAKARVEAGAANTLETINLQAQQNEIKLLERQTKMTTNQLIQQFQMLLNTKENVVPEDSLKVLALSIKDSIANVWLQQARQQIAVETSKIELIKAEAKPSFNVGYSAQNYFEGGWLSGVHAGIQIPFFKSQVKKRMSAQAVEVEIANASYDAKAISLKQQELSVLNTIGLYAEGVEFYRSQLDVILPEMERISELNYKAGELSYLELLHTLNLMLNHKKSYFEQVLAYNQAIVYYQFLSNQ